MRIVVVGLNEQGLQRQTIAGVSCIAITNNLQEIPLDAYDAVIICVDNELKYAVARYALLNNKHVMLDAPLWGTSLSQIDELEQLSITNHRVFYIAYNFCFVPDFVHVKELLQKRKIGEVLHCRLNYAARSDNAYNGALIDLCPQLLNLLSFWFGPEIMQHNFSIVHKDKFGRQIIFADFNSRFTIEVEANFFATVDRITAEIYAARDNISVSYSYDVKQLAALINLEFKHFTNLCQQICNFTDCVLDKWIYAELDRLGSEQMLLA